MYAYRRLGVLATMLSHRPSLPHQPLLQLFAGLPDVLWVVEADIPTVEDQGFKPRRGLSLVLSSPGCSSRIGAPATLYIDIVNYLTYMYCTLYFNKTH